MDSLQKLQTIRQNQMDAIKVVQFLIKRERKKRDLTVCTVSSNLIKHNLQVAGVNKASSAGVCIC